MKALLGRYEGKLNAEGTEAAGTWTQAGNSLPLTLKKTDKVTEVRRPQTPRAPFPYKVVEVSYPNKTGGVTLAGTLTEPDGTGPFPALILISGSGAQDRDETIFEHKPFLVLADALTRRGVAVLRLDDRGVGGSTGSTSSLDQRGFRRRRSGRNRIPQERAARSIPGASACWATAKGESSLPWSPCGRRTSPSSSSWPAPGCPARRSSTCRARRFSRPWAPTRRR